MATIEQNMRSISNLLCDWKWLKVLRNFNLIIYDNRSMQIEWSWPLGA